MMNAPFLLRGGVTSALVLAFSGPALAVPFTENNVFVSTGVGTVLEYTPTGTLVQTLNVGSGFITGSAFDSAGNFFVTRFSDNLVQKFDSSGTDQGPFGGGYSTPESVVLDASGNVLVGSIGGGIRKFDSAGNFLSSAIPGTRVDFMDLAADQRTMYYGQEGGEIHRADVLTGLPLSDFSVDVENAFALRILSNGNVLVADGADIELLDADGAQIGTFDAAGTSQWFALNLDPDGESFWSAGTNGFIARFDLASGDVITSWNVTGTNGTWGLAVFGEITQGGGGGNGGGGGTVPEPSVLGLLGAGFLGLLFGKRRRIASRA